MKIFCKVKEIREPRSGVSARTGNTWTVTPIIFEDPQGTDILLMDIFDSRLPAGLRVGMEGYLVFNTTVRSAQSGAFYNEFRFGSFTPVSAQLQAQPQEAAPAIQAPAPAPTAEGAAPAPPTALPTPEGKLPF